MMTKLITQRRLLAFISMAILSLACGEKTVRGQSVDRAESQSKAIRTVIQSQADAWNRGDIDRFMDHYWKSEQLTFSSGGKTTRGWQATIDGYKNRYSTPERMGRLSFTELEVFPLTTDAAYVLGKWQLQRDDPIGGNFSLIFRNIEGSWLIVHDHTSVDAPQD